MIRRQHQQQGPAPEDRSRHEDAVAKFLSANMDADDVVMMKALPTSEKLALLLGRAHVVVSDSDVDDKERAKLVAAIVWLTAAVRFQLYYEENPA